MSFLVVVSLFFVLLVASIASGGRVARATISYQNEALKAANTRRAAHCAPPLKLDSELSRLAQKRAEEICRTKNNVAGTYSFRGKDLGENRYSWRTTEPMDIESRPGSEPINDWYRDGKNYDFENPGYSAKTGAFTQLLWSYSKLVGFGVCLADDQRTMYAVATFFPRGNDAGIFESNVQPTTCE